MVCPKCRASIRDGLDQCPKCAVRLKADATAVLELFKQYPWLPVLLACSALLTLWAATRRPPDTVVVSTPPAVEAAPAPAPEPVVDDTPLPLPPMPASAAASKPEPEPRPIPAGEVGPANPPAGGMREDGTWDAGPGAPKRGGAR